MGHRFKLSSLRSINLTSEFHNTISATGSVFRVQVNELRPEKIQAFYNEKLDRGTGVRMVRLIHAVLHGALNHALKLGLVYRNPSDAVYKPKAPKKEMRVLDEKQVRSLLIAARGKRFKVLYKIAITTGLRQGEILGLKWADWATSYPTAGATRTTRRADFLRT